MRANQVLTIAAPGLLGNDSDAVNDTLTLAFLTTPAHGTVVAFDDGSFTYTPDTGFIGAERVAALRAAGTDRKLAPFLIEGAGIPRPGNPVMLGDETVGEVTSGTFSPTLKKNIGLGYFPVEYAALDAEIDVLVREKPLKAKVVKLPFYKRNK